MAEIEVVLLTVRWSDEYVARLREHLQGAEVVRTRDDDEIVRTLARADVAILSGDLDDRFADAPHLRWVHCDHAGLNKSARPWVFERGLLVTSSSGRSAPALAEHAIFFMLLFAYRYPAFMEAQRTRPTRQTAARVRQAEARRGAVVVATAIVIVAHLLAPAGQDGHRLTVGGVRQVSDLIRGEAPALGLAPFAVPLAVACRHIEHQPIARQGARPIHDINDLVPGRQRRRADRAESPRRQRMGAFAMDGAPHV